MYKMLIVDDEERIARGLKNIINWENYNIEICGIALDGIEALEIVEEKSPDILLTDISMPRLDGLQMTKKLRERGYDNLKIVILSGYDDFSYAKKAIEYGVKSYLLKPTDINELIHVMSGVVDICEREKLEKIEKINSWEMKYKEFFHKLLKGKLLSREEIENSCNMLNLPVLPNSLYLVSLDNLTGSKEALDRIMDYLHSIKNAYILSESYELLSFVYILSEKENREDINLVIKGLMSYINDELFCHANLYISDSTNDYTMLNKLYTQCEQIASHSLSFHIDETIIFNKLNSFSKSYSVVLSQLWSISEFLNKRDVDSVSLILRKIFLNQDILYDNHYYEDVCRYLDLIIAQYSKKTSHEIEHMKEIYKSSNTQLYDHYTKLIKDNFSHSKPNLSSKNSEIYKEIKKHLDSKYTTQITLNDLTNDVDFSPNYINVIFKKNAGITIKEYIIERRIQRAIELIESRKYSLYLVSEMVGYQNYEYFRKLFKKNTGSNPSDY